MEILNPKVSEDLAAGRPIGLDLGSGGAPRAGFYAVDHVRLPGVDILADLNAPMELLPEGCADRIHSRHALEHVREFLPLMREIHRVTRPGGRIEITVPHFSNVYGFSDPTHVRFFGLHTMFYFVPPEHQPRRRKVPAFYTDVSFRVESVRLEFYRNGLLDRLVAPAFSFLVNRSYGTQEFYERRLSGMVHAWQIRYVMAPLK